MRLKPLSRLEFVITIPFTYFLSQGGESPNGQEAQFLRRVQFCSKEAAIDAINAPRQLTTHSRMSFFKGQ